MAGRLMTDTKIVSVKGIDFEIGIISRKIFRKLSTDISLAARLILKPGEEISAEVLDKKREENQEAFFKSDAQMFDAYYELVRRGLKSCKNFLDKDGKEISLTKDPSGLLTNDAIDLLDLNGFIGLLGPEIFTFNKISDDEKKN